MQSGIGAYFNPTSTQPVKPEPGLQPAVRLDGVGAYFNPAPLQPVLPEPGVTPAKAVGFISNLDNKGKVAALVAVLALGYLYLKQKGRV